MLSTKRVCAPLVYYKPVMPAHLGLWQQLLVTTYHLIVKISYKYTRHVAHDVVLLCLNRANESLTVILVLYTLGFMYVNFCMM